MAPLPQNNTSRMFYDYISQTGGREHTFAVRIDNSGVTGPQIHQAVTDFLTALTPGYFASGWRILRARLQVASTDFSLPDVLPPGLTTFQGSGGALQQYEEPLEYTFVGRSPSTGRRARLSLYGMRSISLATAYRVELPDANYPTLLAAIQVLNAQTGIFVAIDLSEVNWYSYVNWQYNSYWERQVRAGS